MPRCAAAAGEKPGKAWKFQDTGSGNGATQHKAATVNGLLCNFPPRLKTCHHPAGSTQDIYRFLNKNKTETFPVNALRHLLA